MKTFYYVKKAECVTYFDLDIHIDSGRLFMRGRSDLYLPEEKFTIEEFMIRSKFEGGLAHSGVVEADLNKALAESGLPVEEFVGFVKDIEFLTRIFKISANTQSTIYYYNGKFNSLFYKERERKNSDAFYYKSEAYSVLDGKKIGVKLSDVLEAEIRVNDFLLKNSKIETHISAFVEKPGKSITTANFAPLLAKVDTCNYRWLDAVRDFKISSKKAYLGSAKGRRNFNSSEQECLVLKIDTKRCVSLFICKFKCERGLSLYLGENADTFSGGYKIKNCFRDAVSNIQTLTIYDKEVDFSETVASMKIEEYDLEEFLKDAFALIFEYNLHFFDKSINPEDYYTLGSSKIFDLDDGNVLIYRENDASVLVEGEHAARLREIRDRVEKFINLER